MSSTKMKILFIGLGGIGQRHLRNINDKYGDSTSILAYRVRGLRKTVTTNLAIDKSVDFIDKYSVEVFTDLNKALAQSPDVAFVCNPSSLHIPSCLAVAKAGCDFFVEKPLSHSNEGVNELLSICDSNDLVTLVGFQLRFHPCYILFKRLIFEEAIGSLLSVRSEVGEYLPNWHKYEDYRHMYASRKELGGGVILSQIHEIDYLYHLFGLPDRVIALGGHLSRLEIDVEDLADILLEVTFRGKNLPISLHMDYVQSPPSRFCRVVGDNGKITMDLTNSTVIIERPDKEKETHDFSDFDRNRLFVNEIDHFFQCVRTRQQARVPVTEGATSLRIALAIKKSLETGKIIELKK